jgi:ABC-2 type transport system ATP-binding protein
MAAKVIVKDLVKNYGSFEAVRGVSFEVHEGEIFGLLGPNGAGKTSTVECLIGLRDPDGGSITICGADAVAEPGYVKQMIGAQLQSTSLQDKITPWEALKLFGSFYPRHASPESLIERFALAEKAHSKFDTLSGGQKQRLALALAFVNEPEVLFLDEPTTGLDPQSRRELHASIRQMRDDGRTVLLTTHYIEEAHQLCDRIAIIDHGKIIALGKPDELIANSQSRQHVRLKSAPPVSEQQLSGLPSVTGVRENGDCVEVFTTNVSQTILELVKKLDSLGSELIDLSVHKPSLEDVFIELTGSRLRD